MFYFPFTFQFVPLVEEFALKHSSPDVEAKPLYSPDIDEISPDINNELRFYELPSIFVIHIFTRPAHNVQGIHKDVYPLHDGRTIYRRSAYNIPVRGCSGSVMEWVDGEVGEVLQVNAYKDKIHGFADVPRWKDGFRVVDKLELKEPNFVKINAYHRVSAGNEERIVASLRFTKDLSVTDFYSRLRHKIRRKK